MCHIVSCIASQRVYIKGMREHTAGVNGESSRPLVIPISLLPLPREQTQRFSLFEQNQTLEIVYPKVGPKKCIRISH